MSQETTESIESYEEIDIKDRIELAIVKLVEQLNNFQKPELQGERKTTLFYSVHQYRLFQKPELQGERKTTRFYSVHQYRRVARMIFILQFCYELYPEEAQIGEIHYLFPNHFDNKQQSFDAVDDCCDLLNVSRADLGLKASSKGWFYGPIQVFGDDVQDDKEEVAKWNASQEAQPITSDWLQGKLSFECHNAKCILVVEDGGIFRRFVQDGRFKDCIVVTGKGSPDLATREFISQIYRALQKPVFGLADCNPFGAQILNMYQNGGEKRKESKPIPLQWLRLRPSQVSYLSRENGFREHVFQELEDADRSKLNGLMSETHPFNTSEWRMNELKGMQRSKVELEALYACGENGIDFCAEFVAWLIEYELSGNGDTGDGDAMWRKAL